MYQYLLEYGAPFQNCCFWVIIILLSDLIMSTNTTRSRSLQTCHACS